MSTGVNVVEVEALEVESSVQQELDVTPATVEQLDVDSVWLDVLRPTVELEQLDEDELCVDGGNVVIVATAVP